MIRVLRLMEYTFENLEQAQEHFGKCFVPNDGSIKNVGVAGHSMVIRSTMLVTPFSVAVNDGNDDEPAFLSSS